MIRQPRSLLRLLLLAGLLPFSPSIQPAPIPYDQELEWWALRPLNIAPPPSPDGIPSAWTVNPIDRFIFDKLSKENLDPSPPAPRPALLRRLKYDLLGLPPTPEELDAFVRDSGPGAYERVVDRFLASPQYGERWGRHWLDVIRFGESRGFERNEIITTAWPFRDYIIRSLNEDKPFNQLILEHIAGDQIGKDQPEIEIGSAFLVCGPYDDVGNQDALQAQIIRANTIDEIITAAGTAFLGLTINCARCHDHKFDPVSMEDYYRMYATFAGVVHGERPLATPEQRELRSQKVKPMEERLAQAEKNLADFERDILNRQPYASYPDSASASKSPPRPAVDVYLTEDTFAPAQAKFVRLTVQSNNRDPRNAAGARIDEFEVWTAADPSENVALAARGASVSAPARRAEDFEEAYAPELMIDGAYGAKWIADRAAVITITLARPALINRVAFSGDRGKAQAPTQGENTFVGEYLLEISPDGQSWTVVADSRDRAPINAAFARERTLQQALASPERARHAALQKTVADLKSELRQVPPLPSVWAGRYEQPKKIATVMKGGDPSKPGAEVHPASLSTLSRVNPKYELPKDAPEGARRLAWAKWVVQEKNPLTPRVLANRVWHYHFGVGIVDTPSDFGKQGGTPTHPELLDYLAQRIHFHGWRLKPLHREIVLSLAYQQSADWREDGAASDADTRLLWRFPPRRLSAEELRDTMLSVAGVLNPRMGGPGFRLFRYLQDNVATYLPLDEPGPDTYRRAVYHHNARASRVDLITDFDSPDCAFPAPRRASTTSPLQALTLLNHSFTLKMAQAMARRIETETASDPGPQNLAAPGSTNPTNSKVNRAFLLAYGRRPSDAETRAAAELANAHGLQALCRALLNSSELIYVH